MVSPILNGSVRDYWAQTPMSYFFVALGLVLLSLSTTFKVPFSGNSKIYYPPGLQIVHAWRFFTKRYDFLTDTFKRTHKKFFEFYANQVFRMCSVSTYYFRRADRGSTEWWSYAGKINEKSITTNKTSLWFKDINF